VKLSKIKKTVGQRGWLRNILLFVLTFAVIFGSCAVADRKTEILWDTWGVPHILAGDTPGLFKAFGWAQMHSHGDLILRLYGQARGRGAEYWGEDYIESDRQIITMGIEARSQTWYAEQPPEMRAALDAFVAGINAYAEANLDKIDDAVEVVLPITSQDILAHIQRVVHFNFLIGSNVDALSAIQQWQKGGSNAWAIAPSQSASNNALLLINPHLPWQDRFLFYEAQLTAPEIDAYGCTLVGMPMLVMGFNNSLGWAHTINQHNGWGLYELTLTEKGEYQFDNEVRPLEVEKQIIKVKQSDGTFRDETITVTRSLHGAIIAQNGNKALALRVTGLERSGIIEQYWRMLRAQNLEEFEAALKLLQVPLFTVIYGDRDGQIMHLFNGIVPVRPMGDWQTWLQPVAGDTAETLWTETHPYEDLPRVVNPPSGWLQNANDPPWTTTFPQVLDPNNYPLYLSSQLMNLRAQRSVELLTENVPLSLDKMIQLKFDTRIAVADRFLDDLIAASEDYGGELAQEAIAVLQQWDRQAEVDSRGAVLFAQWAQAMNFGFMPDPQVVAEAWQSKNPLTTPDGLANPADAIATLEEVARQIQANYGRLDVAWGDVYRIQSGNQNLPARGASGDLGSFSVLQFSPTESGQYRATFGDTFIAAVEFSNPIQARVLLPYGNATQPHSTHRGDQFSLYLDRELRLVWRDRATIEANLELRQEIESGE
jgi:acyl-homoserine-lactone acylase